MSELSQLAQGFLHDDPIESRRREVDKIYADFEAAADHDNVIPLSEFRKYEILFSKELRDKYNQHRLSTEEADRIQELSEEFYRRINTQRPTHIVDSNGRDVCPPLPPIFRRLNTMGDKTGGEIASIFHNAFSADDKMGIIVQNKKMAAAYELNREYISRQSESDIIRDRAQFDQMAKNFHQGVLPSDRPAVTKTPVSPSPEQETFEDVEWE